MEGAPGSKYPLIPVEEALEIILQQVEPLKPITVSLSDAHRLVLAEDIKATEPLPPFPASIKVCLAPFSILFLRWYLF